MNHSHFFLFQRRQTVLDVGCGIGGKCTSIKKKKARSWALSPDPAQEKNVWSLGSFHLTKDSRWVKVLNIFKSEKGFEKVLYWMTKRCFALVSDYFLEKMSRRDNMFAVRTHQKINYLEIAKRIWLWEVVKGWEDITSRGYLVSPD